MFRYLLRFYIHLLILTLISVGTFSHAGENVPLPDSNSSAYTHYTLLAPSVVNKDKGETVSFETYLGLAYKAFLAALVAIGILSLMYHGFEYILSESITKKGVARERIKETFIGLGLALASVLLLRTINPDLVVINLFKVGATP